MQMEASTDITSNITRAIGLVSNISTSRPYISSRSFPEYQASVAIWKYCPPVLLVLGGFGNVATIFVLRRINWGQSTQHVFLTALAVVDLLLLYTGLLRQWVKYEFDIDVRELGSAMCKIHTWLVYSLGSCSAWLLTAVTVQRAMSVVWPHRITSLCNATRSGVIVAVILLASFVLYSQNLFFVDITDRGICYQIEGTLQFFIVWSWIDLGVASLFPAFVLIVCNIFLALALHRSAHESTKMRSTRGNTPTSDGRMKMARSMSVTVMLLSVTFLLLTLPTCVYLLWSKYMLEDIRRDKHLIAKARLFWAVSSVLWYTNSAVNFLLYCLSGTKFRNEFVTWITCGNRARNTASHGRPSANTKTTSVSTVTQN